MAEALKPGGLSDMPMRRGGWDQVRPWSDEFSLDEQSLLVAAQALLA